MCVEAVPAPASASEAASAAPSFFVRGFFVGAAASSDAAAAGCTGRAPGPTPAAVSSTLIEGLVSDADLDCDWDMDDELAVAAPAPARIRSYASATGPESASEPTTHKHTRRGLKEKPTPRTKLLAQYFLFCLRPSRIRRGLLATQ